MQTTHPTSDCHFLIFTARRFIRLKLSLNLDRALGLRIKSKHFLSFFFYAVAYYEQRISRMFQRETMESSADVAHSQFPPMTRRR